MKERPILFSGPMVRAILNGTKTQTRRVMRPGERVEKMILNKSPYGIPGDRLWVRETWTGADDPAHKHAVHYRADGERACRWRPSILMPRWASRITLEVTGIRIERLCDITERDALAEGCVGDGHVTVDARAAFKLLWGSLNAKRGYGWDANPWVWVIHFKRIGELHA